MRTCDVEGCPKPHRARGLCSTHYNAQHQPDQHRTVTVTCAYCGTDTQKEPGRAHRYAALFCSLTCRDLYRLEQDAPFAMHEQRVCTIPTEHPARWFGSSCPLLVRHCDRCSTSYVTSPARPRRYCTPRCLWAAQKRHRTIRRRSTVFERDGFRCYLCGKLCDRTATVPHPDAPTVDHLIPRSLGGGNEPDNLGTACFRCNARRGASWQIPA